MYYVNNLIATAVALTCISTVAIAGECTDQIKALQQSAAMTDAKNKPGNQSTPTDTGSAKTEGTASVGADKGAGEQPKTSEAAPIGAAGGGTKSASEQILKATAHDQRGEEAMCMEAIQAAKKLLDT